VIKRDNNHPFSTASKQAPSTPASRQNPSLSNNAQKQNTPSDQSIAHAVSHFLLHPGSRVAIAQSDDGLKAAEFAGFTPRLQIVGLTADTVTSESASETYRLANLSFLPEPTEKDTNNAHIYDGVLNAFNLHEIYSKSNYNKAYLKYYLGLQLDQLKSGGTMVIQGYISPSNDENQCILIELSDYKSNSNRIDKISEADLLIRFSQTARPLNKNGCKGFYLEELKPRTDHTRLFRLPLKWAQEFLLRKDDRENWNNTINLEYTPFTFNSLQQEVTRQGARLVFFSPHWNRKIIEDNYVPRARLFDEDYQLMDYPATSYTAVVQKIEQPESISIREYRNSEEKPRYLNIDHVRDENSGRIYDLVYRPNKLISIIPYRRTVDGRLTVYARDNYARPIVNTIPRASTGLDGKFWSGHLVDPITYEIGLDESFTASDPRLKSVIKETTGLDVKENGHHFDGVGHYASPAMINERVETLFVEVSNPGKNQIEVKHFEDGFHETGRIKALDAQSILKAAHVGLLADGKLELAIYELMNNKGVTPETWLADTVPVGDYQPKRIAQVDDLITDKKADKKRFKQTMRSGSTLSLQRSLFIEEGQVDGETTGIKAKSMEFALPKDETLNIAVVMPLTSDKSGEILAGFQMIDYPAPGRMGDSPAQMDIPAFVLPKEVKTLFDAKKFVAKQFGVKPERVGQMGSSYFCDAGLMPQRIYPFVIASPAKGQPYLSDFIYAPIKKIDKITFRWCKPQSFMKMVAETMHTFGVMHSLSASPGRDAIMKNTQRKPKFSSLSEQNTTSVKQTKSVDVKKGNRPSNEPS